MHPFSIRKESFPFFLPTHSFSRFLLQKILIREKSIIPGKTGQDRTGQDRGRLAKKKKKSSFRTEQRFDPIFHSSERGERGISLFFEMRWLDRRIEVKRTPPSLPPSLRGQTELVQIRRNWARGIEKVKSLIRVSSRARTHALGFQGNPFAFRLLGTVYVHHSIRTNEPSVIGPFDRLAHRYPAVALDDN